MCSLVSTGYIILFVLQLVYFKLNNQLDYQNGMQIFFEPIYALMYT